MNRVRAAVAGLCFLLGAAPAAAQELMTASAAQQFVAGRLFNYSCFDGTEGAGRIFADGSAVGSLRPGGSNLTHHLRLPPGTLFVRDERICATLRGLPFSPCFHLTRLSDTSFRGAISGLSFMYCEFDRSTRPVLARRRAPTLHSYAPEQPTP